MKHPRIPQVQTSHYPLVGGLDLVTPRISVNPGACLDAQNYEPWVAGGYRRINGHERYDGRPGPTSAYYWLIAATITGAVTVGSTLTGVTSGATSRVLAVLTSAIVLGRVVGTYVSGEQLQISAVTVATSTSGAVKQGSASPSDDADYMLLAANDYRADIGKVPGAGVTRPFVLNDTRYVLRDNAGATQSLLYKATSSGWSAVTFGFELQFAARTGIVTITIAAPGVVSWVNHGLSNGQTVVLSTTGALPTGLVVGTTYYIVNATANTFELSATSGGTSITTTGTQSGVHTALLTSASGITAGQTVTGATSGASAVATVVLLRSGTWTVSPLGSIVFAAVTGSFVSGEALQVAGIAQAGTTTASSVITRLPGGTVEIAIGNFNSSVTTKRAYIVDGVNPCGEFDGTTYVPIHTGMASDAPSHVCVSHNKLFLAFLGSLQYSATLNQYGWSVVIGGNEIALGDSITAIAQQTGNNSSTSLLVFTVGKTFVLYGSSSLNFNLVPSTFDIGCFPGTVQPVSNNTFGLTRRGVQSIITTLAYGDFDFDALSFLIQPLVDSKTTLATCSTTLRGKNQYRLYFSDSTALAFGLTGEKLSGIMPLHYGKAVKSIWTSTLSGGAEVTYFGSDDGYVYQDNVGTSLDGAEVESWIRPMFANLDSPEMRKAWRQATFDISAEGYGQVKVSADYGYGSPDVMPSLPLSQTLIGAGAYWDVPTWDTFVWDAPVVGTKTVSLDGTETNINFLLYSKRAQDAAHVVQGITLHYIPRRLRRGS